jgi:hypothetical protein
VEDRYAYYERIVDSVDRAIDLIRAVPQSRCLDVDYLEHELIPALGLNNEQLQSQPTELAAHYGKGLHLWQYPNQLARFLVWLAFNANDMRSYMEVGCRWGGTFIVLTEWLRRIGAPLEFAVAVDPIAPTPFIKRYREAADFPVVYLQMLSTSRPFLDYARSAKPEVVFIDGDHRMAGVMTDHANARKYAKIIVHHDISSDACRDTTLFWQYLKLTEDRFESVDFTQQYESVRGSFLGIGALKRV